MLRMNTYIRGTWSALVSVNKCRRAHLHKEQEKWREGEKAYIIANTLTHKFVGWTVRPPSNPPHQWASGRQPWPIKALVKTHTFTPNCLSLRVCLSVSHTHTHTHTHWHGCFCNENDIHKLIVLLKTNFSIKKREQQLAIPTTTEVIVVTLGIRQWLQPWNTGLCPLCCGQFTVSAVAERVHLGSAGPVATLHL